MIRRLALACLLLPLAAAAARAQVPHASTIVPGRSALGRLGLERHWSAAVPLQFGTERVIHISLAGDGINEPTPAAVYDAPATATRFISDSDLSADDDFYKGADLVFTGGNLKDQSRLITGYRGETHAFAFQAPFPEAPADGDPFEIRGYNEKIVGRVASIPASGARFMTDARLSPRPDHYVGSTLLFTGGELKGEARTVSAYDPRTRSFRFAEPFSAAPADGDSFRIRGGLLFAQTNRANLHAFEAETGRYLWTSNLGQPTVDARGSALNSEAVFVTNSKDLIALDRESGRRMWQVRLDNLPTSPPAASEEMVMVGDVTGKVLGFSTRERLIPDITPPIRKPAGSFLWAWQSNARVTGRPIFADRLIAFASQDGKVYVAVRDPSSLLYRFLTGGAIAGSMATYGNRTLLVPSADHLIYAIDLYTAEKRWGIPTGSPIEQEPLVARRDGAEAGSDAYVVNADGQLFAIDPATGAKQWVQSTGEGNLLAIGKDRIYLENRFHDLFIISRQTGQILHSPRETLERAGLNLREYALALTNHITDRLYFATPSGSVLCLREAGRLHPRELRDPAELPFGMLPEQAGESAGQPEPGAPAGENPPPAEDAGDVPPP